MSTLFIDKYFNGERLESLIFIGIGLITLILGLYFLLSLKKSFYSGMAFYDHCADPIGSGEHDLHKIAKRCRKGEELYAIGDQKDRNRRDTSNDKVMDIFKIYKYVEIALIIISILIILLTQHGSLLKGIGAGLFIQAAIMLAADLFAEERGNKYFQEITSIHVYTI